MLNLMRSILIRLKKLKTCKRICSVLFSCILGLLFFMSFSSEAFASNVDWDEISGGMTIDNQGFTVQQGAPETITIAGSTRYKTDITVTLSWRQYYNFDYYYSYYGYLDLSYRIWLQCGYNLSTSTGIFNYRLKDIVTENPNTKVIVGNPSVSYENSKPYLDLGSIRITEFLDTNLYESGQNNANVSIVYEVVYSTASAINTWQKYWDNCSVMYNKLYRTKNTALTLRDIYFIDSYIYNELISQNSFLENNLDQKLDDILAAIQDIDIIHDYSGVSDNLNSEVSSAGVVESEADQAIASALPDVDNELDDILNYDYTSIGSDSLTALSFWKSLGDYILSNSNLVGIGALLVACLFLGFVIYLLRL